MCIRDSKGKIINDLQARLNQEFTLTNPKLKVEEVKNPTLNAQVMAEKIASSLERGWYHRRSCHSAARTSWMPGLVASSSPLQES